MPNMVKADDPDECCESPKENDDDTALPDVRDATSASQVPEGGWGWVVLAASYVTLLLIGGLAYTMTLFYQAMLVRYEQMPVKTAWVFSLNSLFRLITGPLVGMLCSRFSHRRVLLLGSLLTPAALVTSAFAPSIEVLYVSFGIVLGACGCLLLVPCLGILTLYFEKKRGRVMAVALSGCSVGGMIMPPLTEYLLDQYGYTGGLLMLAGIMMHCCVAAALCRHPRLVKHVPLQKPVVVSNGEIIRDASANPAERLPQGSVLSLHIINVYHSCQFIHHRDLGGMVRGTSEECIQKGPATSNIHLSRAKQSAAFNTCSLPCLTSVSPLQGTEILTYKQSPQDQHQTNEDISQLPPQLCKHEDEENMGNHEQNREKNRLYSQCRSIATQLGFGLLRRREVAMLCIPCVGHYFCYTTLNTFISGLAAEAGISTFHVAFMITIASGLDILFLPLTGFAFDTSFIHKWKYIFYFLLACAMCALVISVPSIKSTTVFFLVCVPCCSLISSTYSLNMIFMGSLVKGEGTRAFGVLRFIMGIGGFAAPSIGAALANTTGTYATAFYFAVAVYMSTAIVFGLQRCCKKSSNVT